jgi:hypothetical protein
VSSEQQANQASDAVWYSLSPEEVARGLQVDPAVGPLALTVPGLGPLAVAGPLAAAVVGAIKGGALGALAGSFAGLGMPAEDARRYEAFVRAGGEFVVVRAPDQGAARQACGLLERRGAHDCARYAPAP